MSISTLTLGLIPAPDMPTDIVNKIKDVLIFDLKKYIDSNVHWRIEVAVDPLTGTAEEVNTVIDKASVLKQEHGWDYAVSLTDLPSFVKHKVATADVNFERNVGLLSLPAFGAFPLKKRIRKALIFVVDLLYENKKTTEFEEQPSHLTSRFLFTNVERVEAKEHQPMDARFIMQSSLLGWLRIVAGMTFANRPWQALGSFKKILALAFATGTYISIFTTPWQLSVVYSPLRLSILTLASITGMVAWIIFSHKLWEGPSSKGQSKYRKLYNFTTVMTLTSISVIIYIFLFIAMLVSISIFVPMNLFESWAEVNPNDSIYPLARLAWLVSSLGFLAGAVGSTAEKEEDVRNITYSYRQLNRKHQIERENSASINETASSPDWVAENQQLNNKKRKTPQTTTIGLIAAPELADDLSRKLIHRLPKVLAEYVSKDIYWEIEKVVDPLTGGAEVSEEIFKEALYYREAKEWDYIISLTDLPIFHGKDIVTVDIEEDTGTGLVSIPAFGWRPVFKRVEKAIVQTVQQMMQISEDPRIQEESVPADKTPVKGSKLLRKQFPVSTIRKIQEKLEKTGHTHTRYLVVPRVNGNIRLLSGMTFANKPLQLMPSLTSVIAIAFTTGAFGMIFTTMWELSYLFSNWRLTGVSISAILGMTIWMIIAHDLWESRSSHGTSYQPRRVQRLYNFTTFATLLIAIITYYAVIFLLFTGVTLLFIPQEFLTETLSMDQPAGIIEYLQLAWFASSISTIAGGIGAGLENDEVIRDATYGYRQKRRYAAIHKEE